MITSRTKTIAIVILVPLLAVAGWFWHLENKTKTKAGNTTLLQQGIERFEQENYLGALETLQKIPADEIEDWRVLYYIGSAHMMLKDYNKATQALDRALVLNSQQTGVLYALGVSHYKQGNIGLAKAYFSAVLDINPNDEHARGLMDIMSRLQRQQPGQENGHDTADNSGDGSSHS